VSASGLLGAAKALLFRAIEGERPTGQREEVRLRKLMEQGSESSCRAGIGR